MNPDNPHSFEPEQSQPPRWSPSLEDLIDRVALTQEAIQLDQVPLLERAKVLALLKQAQALERIAQSLEIMTLQSILEDSEK